MKAVVFHGVGDVRVDDVPEPEIREPNDAIVRISTTAICGTDLHLIRGTMPGMEPGTIIGHEAVGIVEKVASGVRNFREGDRVVIASSIACGYCAYCRSGYFAQCDNANPNGPRAGTCFFGGPKSTGSIPGLQAEKARIPFANVGMVKLPDDVTDEEAIMLSDVFPTGYFGAELAEIKDGDTVAVFGCGPVGLFAIMSAFIEGAGRVLAVDRVDSRLEMARDLGAEMINFEKDDVIQVILDLTGGIGVDRAIDAVGIDAVHPEHGPGAEESAKRDKEYAAQLRKTAPETVSHGETWRPGDAPSQAMTWCVQSLAKAGTMSVIGVYPESVEFFPFGMAMNKNLTINAGNCNHRDYIPFLLELVQSRAVRPASVLTSVASLPEAVDAYKAFDKRHPGWIKVALLTQEGGRTAAAA